MLAQKDLKLGQELPQVEQPLVTTPTPVTDQESLYTNRSVAELELSVRSRKALQRLGITTLGELVARSEAELILVKNFGHTSLQEIQQQLARHGLALRDSPA